MSFLKSINISTKIFGGFASVLALLLIISATGALELTNGNDNFKRYRSIALQTNQAGRVQANLLEARLAVKNFILSASPDTITEVKERASKTLELNREFATMVESDEKKAAITEAEQNLNDYLYAFDEVVMAQAMRDDLVATLDKVGPEMEQKLTEIMHSAHADKDINAAYNAGSSLRNLLLMRLYATKFLVTNDAKAFERVQRESRGFAQTRQVMTWALQNPARKKLAAEVGELHKKYDATVKEVNDTIIGRNDVIRDSLDTIGPKVAANLEQLKLDIKKEQDTLGPAASAAMDRAVLITTVVSVVSILLGALAAWAIGTGISKPIQAITASMKTLAGGDKTIDIPGQDHGDEVGDMAEAVQVFKDNMIKADEMAAREAAEARERDARAQKLTQLTQDFDAGVSSLLVSVTDAATEMENTATSMSSIADETNTRATTVAAAAEQASANVQTVATATEELSSSIQEISRQVSQSSQIAGRAVDEANRTDQQVQGLADAANRIGEVVSLISDIAEQTNLLALNATIEAARAGDAGKGFAVVASEVKNLANQTAKATEEISQQISGIQSETENAVTAIQSIGSTINEINEIASTIAAAVEEQGAATGEIARSVEQAATGTQDVSSNIVEVTRAAGDTGSAAGQVTGVARDLNAKADDLKAQVDRFLADVRAV